MEESSSLPKKYFFQIWIFYNFCVALSKLVNNFFFILEVSPELGFLTYST